MAIFTTIGYVILAICVLLVMVLIHEFGHYCIGRWLGFKITEFSIGFGKAIFSKVNKRGEKISLRIFPLLLLPSELFQSGRPELLLQWYIFSL